jgi:hypothetical protein
MSEANGDGSWPEIEKVKGRIADIVLAHNERVTPGYADMVAEQIIDVVMEFYVSRNHPRLTALQAE